MRDQLVQGAGPVFLHPGQVALIFLFDLHLFNYLVFPPFMHSIYIRHSTPIIPTKN